jgi:hypothetical protein
MKRLIFLILAGLPIMSAVAQRADTSTKNVKAVEPPNRHQELTMDSVVSMVQAGLSDEIIVTRLRKEGKAFDLSPDDMVQLKKAHVSDAVLKTMLDPKAEVVSSATASSHAPPQPLVPVASPMLAMLGAPASNPSGATPAPGTTELSNSNDPLAPHDSGIYLLTKDRDGRPRMSALERTNYQGANTGGMFTSAMTYGIKKVKMKAVIPGARASIRASDPNLEFYFYFDEKAAGLGKGYFGGNLSSPNQFALIKLAVLKSSRQTTTAEFGAFGTSSGTNAKSMIEFRSERIRSGIYKVVMNQPLQAGEYCFLASTAGLGPYGAGSAGASDLFDFGVDPNQ